MADAAWRLELERVSKRLGQRLVLDDMSVAVEQGEVVGLFGRNGAGKSSAFNMLVGRERVSKGRVMLRRRDISEVPLQGRARLRIGYVPQESSVFKGLSVRDNLMLVMQQTGVAAEEREARVHGLLERLGLLHVEGTGGRWLSGGERKRVELARALASNCGGGPPKLLLLDEPFAGVDAAGVCQMLRQLRQLCDEQGMGILVTDHKVKSTLQICNRAYIIHQGRVVASAEPHSLYADRHIRQSYIGEM